jgi:GAF domain-containing protein
MTEIWNDAANDFQQTIAELHRRFAERTAERDELLRQQTATADVLKVISRSAFDLQTVLDTLVQSATRLCDADEGTIWRPREEHFVLAASCGLPPPKKEFLGTLAIRAGDSGQVGRALLTGKILHVHDVLADPNYQLQGDPDPARTRLQVPLRRDGKSIGMFILVRKEVRPFSETQIELVQTFADQTVIALENTRLFKEAQDSTAEVTEALERQTATSEILRVISQSPTDVQPVFDTIAQTAVRLLKCDRAFIQRCDDSTFWTVAWCSPEGQLPITNSTPIPIDPKGNFPSRVMVEKKTLHLPDWSTLDLPEFEQDIRAKLGINCALYLPLLREGKCIGVLGMAGKGTNIFGESEIALAESFRDQALIAIENVRLFNETREALERQTATADILKVISSSVADTTPVFEQILDSCERLAAFNRMAIFLLSEDGQVHIGAYRGGEGDALKATFPQPLANTPMSLAFQCQQALFFGDVLNNPDAPESLRVAASRMGSFSVLVAPLLWEGRGIGAFHVARNADATFSDREVALLKTFADQAAIAIQNARLFNETKQALERQTATADILKVIASSPSDVQPVFEAIAASAKKLIGGFSAVVQRFIGDDIHLAAFTPTNPEADATLQASFPTPISQFPVFLQVRDGETVEFADTEAEDVPRLNRDLARLRGYRSMLFMPLMNNGAPIGMISITRKEPGSFADHHVELVRTFADQAVIAIENVRLFDEVQAKTSDLSEALQQQTATADVLKVISRSAFDLQAVLTTLVRSALDLCNAPIGTFFLREGDVLRLASQVGCTPELVQYFYDNPIPLNQSSGAGRAFSTGRVVHFPDVLADPDYRLSEVQRLGDYRSLLAVPLLREQETIGVFSLSRTRPEPFSQRQIDLVQTFADQAVIAIENTRLFNETRKALERQTATGHILRIINQSPSDVTPVFDAIAERARVLCGALLGATTRFDGELLHLVGYHGVSPEAEAVMRSSFPRKPDLSSINGRCILAKAPVQIADIELDPQYLLITAAKAADYRALLAVPMLRGGEVIGVIAVTRKEPGEFPNKLIELLQTFADQAVIAIQNADLFNEAQTRTRELSASLDELRTAQDRLVQTEKLASLGQLTAGIAHEIKNPLNFVNNFSALSAELVDEMTEVFENTGLDEANRRKELDEIRELLKSNLEKVVQHGKRADSIVKNMLLHSREGSGEQRPADINALLDESLNLAYHGARAEKPDFNITLRRDLDPDAGAIDVFPQEITRAFINLISNGFYAASKRKAENGEADFEPVLSAATKNLGNHIEICIRDNGTGIPPEVKDKIFNPFFTTKPSGEGTGLGLSMSHDIIVKQHGGKIDVETEPGLFTEFKIVLPRNSQR